jgi:hypothetical protein
VTQSRLLTATVQPCKCDNPNHAQGCGLGYRLVDCEEEEAHTWVASIVVGNRQLWGSNGVQSVSREAATTALLERLAEGVEL